MGWWDISIIIVIAVVCFASTVAILLLVSCLNDREETCADAPTDGAEEEAQQE